MKMAEMNALVIELMAAEARMNVTGWENAESYSRDRWQSAYEQLNVFFSPLEIRELIWRIENGR